MELHPLSITALTLPLLLAACGGSAPAAEEPPSSSSSSTTQSSTPTSSAQPAHPPAVNAGQPITTPLLDDLEDGDGQIAVADARGGYWYVYADAGSTIEPQGNFAPAPGGANDSQFAARMHGTIGDTEQYPYAGMGFSFLDPKQAYDVSSCEGIVFFARKAPGTSVSNLRMKVGDVNTVPEGGVCKDCFNDFGRDILLTDEWSEIKAPFYQMKQEPYWGEPKPQVATSHVYQVQFQVKDRGPFDVWIDDVQLYGCK